MSATAYVRNLVGRMRRRLSGSVTLPVLRDHNDAILYRMARYDMVADPDEPHYATQYIEWIKRVCLPQLPANATVIDVGCGQGRLTLQLATINPEIYIRGVDLSHDAITKARAYATGEGLTNVEFFTGDAMEFVRALPAASVDLVIFAEVAFWYPEYAQLLKEFARVIRPGGFVAASFWSQYYRLLKAVKDRQWTAANLIARERKGRLSPGLITFTWQQPEEVRAELRDAGFDKVELVGIGGCSGIGAVGDALTSIAQPSLLPDTERRALLEIEMAIARDYPGVGRYILALARK